MSNNRWTFAMLGNPSDEWTRVDCPSRIILIDGQRLTDLMIRYGVGVQNQQTLHVVAVDEDFFE